jgi:hypothetical protein
MSLSIFSLKVGFAPSGHAKGLSQTRQLRNSPVGFRQDGLKHARCPNAFAFGFPRLLKLLWLKPPFARKPPDSFYTTILALLTGGLGVFKPRDCG